MIFKKGKSFAGWIWADQQVGIIQLRILYLSRSYTPHDVRFLTTIAKGEHEVYFLTLESESPVQDSRSLPDGVQRVDWDGSLPPFSLLHLFHYRSKFKKIIQKINPDLIHAGPIQTCAFIAATSGFKPFVSMSWGSDLMVDSHKNFVLEKMTKYTLQHSTLLWVDNQAVEKRAIELGMLPRRIIKFPWGVNLEQFSPGISNQIRSKLGWQDHFVLLSLRAFEPIYGVDILVRAFCEAAKEEPDIRLLLLGDGTQFDLMRGIVQEYKAEDFVHFMGRISQDELPILYQNADLYVSASLSDGSSVSLMEALASGLPVLVSDIPGNQEWVQPGENGWFFKTGNVIDLKEKIISIFRSQQVLPEVRLHARRVAEEKADWSEHARTMMKAYDYALRLTKG